MKRILPYIWLILTITIVLMWTDRLWSPRYDEWAMIRWGHSLSGWFEFVVWPWTVAGVWLATAFGLGLVFGERTGLLKKGHPLLVCAIGAGLLSLVVYLLGLAHLLYWWVLVWIPAGVSWCIVLWHRDSLRLTLTGIVDGVRSVAGWHWIEKLMLALIVYYLVRTGLATCHPRSGWDECNSHLVLARYYLRDHAILWYPEVNFQTFPPLLHMLLVCQMAFTRTPGAVIPWLFHVGTLGVIWLLVRDVFGAWKPDSFPAAKIEGLYDYKFRLGWRGAALIAIILYLMIPLVTLHSQAVLADPVLVFYCGLLLWWWVKSHQCRWNRWFLISVMLAGFVISTKLTGVVWIGVILIVDTIKSIVWRIQNKKMLVYFSNSTFQFCGIALLLCLPWMVRNIVLTGNPIFPTLDSIIPSHWGLVPADVQAELVIDYWAMLNFFRVDWLNWYEILGLVDPAPWTSRFPQPNLVGPWMLVLSPLLVWVWKDLPRPGKVALGVGIGYVAVWLLVIGILHGRYMWPAYPVICAGLGVGVTKLMEGRHERQDST